MGAPLEMRGARSRLGSVLGALMHGTLTIRVWLVSDYNVFSPLCEIISRVHSGLFLLVGMNLHRTTHCLSLSLATCLQAGRHRVESASSNSPLVLNLGTVF